MFSTDYSEIVNAFEIYLDKTLTEKAAFFGGSFYEGIRYATKGGKRLRPILTALGADAAGGGGDYKDAFPFALAVELIHSYSLIHDDLPCMDDDDLRRGQPTVHKAFGEAEAVLIGDELLTLASEVLIEAAEKNSAFCKAAAIVIRGAGIKGMLGGQYVDVTQTLTEKDKILKMYEGKTGALLSAAVRSGACCSGADETTLSKLNSFALALGCVFQIQDDLLDIEGDAAIIGKNTGSDAKIGKPTIPVLLGCDEARVLIADKTAEAFTFLEGVKRTEELKRFANGLLNRRK